MRALGIPLITRHDPPERIEYLDRRKWKEPDISLAGQEPMILEEVTKLLMTMANDMTKVKQGQVAHSFVGPTPRAQKKPIRNQPQLIRPPNVLQRENKL